MTDTDRVTVELIDGPTPVRDADGWEHYAYRLRLHFDGRSMDCPWKQGTGIESDPTARDVLACVLLDASGADQPFEDWAADFGYDTDSRKAEATYRAVREQTEKLRQLLGADTLTAALRLDSETAARRYAAPPE